MGGGYPKREKLIKQPAIHKVIFEDCPRFTWNSSIWLCKE